MGVKGEGSVLYTLTRPTEQRLLSAVKCNRTNNSMHFQKKLMYVHFILVAFLALTHSSSASVASGR